MPWTAAEVFEDGAWQSSAASGALTSGPDYAEIVTGVVVIGCGQEAKETVGAEVAAAVTQAVGAFVTGTEVCPVGWRVKERPEVAVVADPTSVVAARHNHMVQPAAPKPGWTAGA